MGDVNTLLPAGNTCLHGEDGLVHLDLCSLITVIHEFKIACRCNCMSKLKYAYYTDCVMNRITLQIQLRGFVVEYFFLIFFLLF